MSNEEEQSFKDAVLGYQQSLVELRESLILYEDLCKVLFGTQSLVEALVENIEKNQYKK